MGFILTVTFVFSIPDVGDALNDETGYPFLYVFKLAMPNSGVACMSVLMLVLLIVGNISTQASTARQTFAFARDKGLPFSAWLAKVGRDKHILCRNTLYTDEFLQVHPRLHVPVNSVIFSFFTAFLLSMIYIGSAEAFNAIVSPDLYHRHETTISTLPFPTKHNIKTPTTAEKKPPNRPLPSQLSLGVVAQQATYAISMSCVLHRRLTRPDLLPKCRWSLGRWGIPINICAIAYCWTMFFWCFWPISTPVDASSFNWASVMFAGTLGFSMVFYFVRQRFVYRGPVAYTVGWREAEAEAEREGRGVVRDGFVQ